MKSSNWSVEWIAPFVVFFATAALVLLIVAVLLTTGPR